MIFNGGTDNTKELQDSIAQLNENKVNISDIVNDISNPTQPTDKPVSAAVARVLFDNDALRLPKKLYETAYNFLRLPDGQVLQMGHLTQTISGWSQIGTTGIYGAGVTIPFTRILDSPAMANKIVIGWCRRSTGWAFPLIFTGITSDMLRFTAHVYDIYNTSASIDMYWILIQV